MNILTMRADKVAFPVLLVTLFWYLVLAIDAQFATDHVWRIAIVPLAALAVLLFGIICAIAIKEHAGARTGVMGEKASAVMLLVLGFGLIIRLGAGAIGVLVIPAALICDQMRIDESFFGDPEPCLSIAGVLLGLIAAVVLARATTRLLRERYVWNPRHLRVVVPTIYILALASAPCVLFL